jgi:hypothetical protein
LGSLDKIMLEAINKMEKNEPHSTYLPIIQSSGTGKSRMVHQLAQLVFTIPFNLRAGNETTSGMCL